MRSVITAPRARWPRLSYRASGERSDITLIFVHGAVGDSRLFRYQLKFFGSRYRSIAIDLPGHGHSRGDRLPGLADFTDALEDVAAHEGASSCVLVGHSMGGGVCLEAWKRGMRGIRAMVLVSTSAVLPVSPELVSIVERDDMDALAELIVGSVFSNRADLLIGFAKKGLYEMQRSIIGRDVEICRLMDYRDILEGIRVPVLVVANRGDAVISWEETAALEEEIPSARMVVFEASGHVPFFEQHREFNAVLAAFLDDVA